MRGKPAVRVDESPIVSSVCKFVKMCASLSGKLTSEVLQHLHFITGQKAAPVKMDSGMSSAVLDYQYQNTGLDCNVIVEQDHNGEQIFTVQIRGRIQTDQPDRKVHLNVKFDDLINGDTQAAAVYVKPVEGDSSKLKPFEFICDLGRLNKVETEIPDWLSVAKIRTSMMMFAQRGNRRLLLKGSVFNQQSGEQFAVCHCLFEYENCEYGYIDVAQNIERCRALAVTLAFSLCAVDGKMYKSELQSIKDWAHSHISLNSCRKTQNQLDRAIRKTIRFFKKGYKIDIAALAGQLAQIAPAAQRYDIIEMCLSVVGSKGFVSAGQTNMLKKLAVWLDIEPERFRNTAERLTPANMHEVKDMELIFGLDANMTREQTREKLNDEYRKWNARITNIDPNIQTQAEQMLNLITQARSRYIG